MEQKLPPRQMQVAQLYAEGHTRQEIAVILCLKPTTINWYLKEVYATLEVHNKIQFLRVMTCNGLA